MTQVEDQTAAEPDLPAPSWIDAFPWLVSTPAESELLSSDPALTAPAEGSPDERGGHIARIATLAIERRGHWPVGELFPGLPDVSVLDLGLPVRPVNVLMREGLVSTGLLADLTINELLRLRNMGVGSLEQVVRALADISTVPRAGQLAQEQGALRDGPGESGHAPTAPAPPAWLDALTRDLEVISEWNATVGLTSHPLLGPAPFGAPESVREIRTRLDSLTAADVLPGVEVVPSAADHMEGALWELLDERARIVLNERLFADEPRTLDSLGKELDVTRERIRQIESRARAKLTDLVEAETSMIGRVAEAARREVWMLRPLADLIESLPGLGAEVHSARQPLWRVLDRLDDAYEIEDGWCAVPTLSSAQEETRNYLDDLADDYGVVRLTDFDVVVPEGHERPEWIPEWLAHCGYELRGDRVLTRTGSVNDLAAAILAVEGAPLRASEILERFHKPRSIGSLRNALATDHRFRKVDVDKWSLADWQMDEYSSIRDEIGKALAARGGIAMIGDLVEEITDRFSVSANSVIAYASSYPFRLRDGVVMEQGTAQKPTRGPESTRGYYWRDGAWVYRLRISPDHLRGSGFPGHAALGSILGLKPGDQLELPSRLDPQKIYWTSLQPQVGTIRRFLTELDAEVDDEVFLVYTDDGSFDVELLPSPPTDVLARALQLTGCPTDLTGEAAMSALGAAIGLGVRKRSAIEEAYRRRGDTEVAELLAALSDF